MNLSNLFSFNFVLDKKSKTLKDVNLRKFAPVQLHDLVLHGARFFENPAELLSSPQDEINPKLEMSGFFPKFYDSNPKTLELLDLIIIKYEPITVVETGVANGLSTRTILNSFKKNSLTNSSLHSFDIDEKFAVEEFTKNQQFHFHKISGKNDFRSAIKDIPLIDLFYHDSDHSYDNQMMEYETVWEKIPQSGVFLSDDINWSNAFLDFCFRVGRKPFILADTEKFAGMIIK